MPDGEFEALHIKGKDIKLFHEIYEFAWENEVYRKLFFEDEEFIAMLEDNTLKNMTEDEARLGTLELEYPEDKYFYQLGVSKLNIKELKFYLEMQITRLYINRITGEIDKNHNIQTLNESNKIDIKNYIQLDIDSPIEFLKQLRTGEIDKILENKRKFPSLWKVQNHHPLSEHLDYLNIEEFLSELVYGKCWIVFRDYGHMQNFTSYKEFSNIKIYERYSLSDNVKKVFFKISDTGRMRTELLKGNMEILNEIKNITLGDIFLLRKNEV